MKLKAGDIENGFKIIKHYGFFKDRGVSWALIECKVCKRHYEGDPNKLKYRKHCGCLRNGEIACKYAKSHPQLANAYSHMRKRCYSPQDQDYYNYGARGITICEEWLKDRNKFCEWSLTNGFENDKGLSIDRIDSAKGYSPENCRWVDAVIQGRNTRRNVLTMEIAQQIREDSKTMSIHRLAKKYNACYSTIWNVITNKAWI